MLQIEYDNAAFGLRLEYPSEWDAQSISSVTIGVKDLGGVELLAATAATPWAAVDIRLNGAVETFDNTITLEPTGVGSVPATVQGDRLHIAQDGSGPTESVEVLHYASNVATLTRDLRYDHADETAVVGLFCTYDLDTSDTDTFSLGKQLVITWTPSTDDLPIKERAEIVKASYAMPDFEELFAATYPRRYQAAITPEGRLERLLESAKRQLGTELKLRNLEIDRVMDQRLLDPSLMAKVAWLSLLTGDDRYDSERKVTLDEYTRQFELLCSAPIWQDTDQDEVLDTDEVEDHVQYGGYERGL
jgi:hypothetical protein